MKIIIIYVKLKLNIFTNYTIFFYVLDEQI